MRYSQLFLPTVKENPSDAETISHQLMIRAGMIRKLTSGIYSYLPLGYRVLRKVMGIIREEMDRAGAQEVLMPVVQPAELWQESGRWELYGKELLRFKDRHERDYCLGPTHEEVITDLVRNEIKSYRQLPKNIYQIQTKFRDEIRPRFGVMRCREFIMKDGYSFDADEEAAEVTYGKMYRAYQTIFRRCGLNFLAVEADSGNIGGSFSHEFMVLAETGEDALVFCDRCHYGANLEKAEGKLPVEIKENETVLPIKEVHTPDRRTIEEVSTYLGVEPRKLLKTLIYDADGKAVFVLIRGDREVNEVKVRNYLNCVHLALADETMIASLTGAPRGFTGPVGLKGTFIADYSVKGMVNFVTGANREDYHFINTNLDRDFKVEAFADLCVVQKGDLCPHCENPLNFMRGIEVGHVFKLGTKYSKAMRAVYLDQKGEEKFMIMGCYGIGVDRTVAATIEQNHDDYGIIWPVSIAPFVVIITPVNVKDGALMDVAEELYRRLTASGIDVLFDDRDERAGVKFADADLIGIPLRITVGTKTMAEKRVEIRERKTGEVKFVGKEEVGAYIEEYIKDQMAV